MPLSHSVIRPTTGSTVGPSSLGFVDAPDFYERYPHLGGAHRLKEHQRQVDEGAFELGLDVLLAGLSDHYDQGVRR